jgi:F420-dependent oxidoreductase-like protein
LVPRRRGGFAIEVQPMRIGIMLGATPGPDRTLDGLIAFAKDAEARGFPSLWLAHIFGLDAITSLAVVGRETSRIELGTAVVPTYPRHPTAMAQQALTAGVASDGRFTLGIGLSHQLVIEAMLGLSYDKPATHMREYLAVLAPLLRGEPASHQGERYRVNAGLQVEGAPNVPLLVAALGPVMLGLAARLAQGTITWMTGPKTLSSFVAPTLREAASAADRPQPRIVAGFPVAITDDAEKGREVVGNMLQMYGTLPSYRAMLDREGATGPADIALVGNEEQVGAAIEQLAETGTTDLIAAIAPVEGDTAERTLDFLAARL